MNALQFKSRVVTDSGGNPVDDHVEVRRLPHHHAIDRDRDIPSHQLRSNPRPHRGRKQRFLGSADVRLFDRCG